VKFSNNSLVMTVPSSVSPESNKLKTFIIEFKTPSLKLLISISLINCLNYLMWNN